MKKAQIFLGLLFMSIVGFAQNNGSTNYQNSGSRILSSDKKGITLGGYAQIDYNEPDGSAPGKLDVHRMVLLFGYKFNDKVSFLTEVELEHVKEVYVEQAFVKYTVAPSVNVLAGLMLVPMGIVNEYHEPTTYFGVERPNVDKYIVPTTWRELGLGLAGNINSVSLKYQAYLFNGFVSYKDGNGVLRGSDGLRKGRQKGAESIVSAPNFSAKVDYYGIRGLRLGLAGYFGKTQSDEATIEESTVGIAMVGFDARYVYKNLKLRGQYIHTALSNTEDYNTFTGQDVGSKMDGFYVEGGYSFNLKGVQQLTPFIRYEMYNTQKSIKGAIMNDAYNRDDVTVGLDYKIANGVAFKADYQFFSNAESTSDTMKQFNAGVAVWF